MDSTNPVERPELPDQIISLTDLLVILWHERIIIMILAAAGACVGLALAYAQPKYQTEGLAKLGWTAPDRLVLPNDTRERRPGVTAAEFQYYLRSLSLPQRFEDYVREKKVAPGAGLEHIRTVFAGAGIAGLVEPIKDEKPAVVRAGEQAKEPPITGFRVSVTGPSAEAARAGAALLGEYVMDGIVYFSYVDLLVWTRDELLVSAGRLDNSVANRTRQIEEFRQREEGLKQLLATQSAASRAPNGPVFATEESTHFLPIPVQLSGLAVKLMETSNAIRGVQRELLKTRLLLDYTGRVLQMASGAKTGEGVLRNLDAVKDSFFREQSKSEAAVQQVQDFIAAHNRVAAKTYLEGSAFIMPPTLPTKALTRPTRSLGVGLLAGLGLALLIIFGRRWMRSNRTRLAE